MGLGGRVFDGDLCGSLSDSGGICAVGHHSRTKDGRGGGGGRRK